MCLSSPSNLTSTCQFVAFRFYLPQQGSLTVDGHDIKDVDPVWLRRHMALVSQEPVRAGMTSSSLEAESILMGSSTNRLLPVVGAF